MEAQQEFLTEDVNAVLVKQCSICTSNFPAFNRSLLPGPYTNTATGYYHNCHLLLKAGRLDEAGLFAQLTMVVLKDTVNNPLYVNTLFLQAKIAHGKNALIPAIRQYEQFVTILGTNPVLAADVHLSLSDIFLLTQDYGKADYYLKIWYRYFLPFTAPGTQQRLYDSVTNIFHPPKAISDPETAIQLGTDLFTNLKDTARLTNFYFQIADWYAPRAADSSITYLRKAIAAAAASNNLPQQQKGYLNLSLIEEKRGSFSEALRYRKEFEAIQERIDSILEKRAPQAELPQPAPGEDVLKSGPLYRIQRLVKDEMMFFIILFIMLLMVIVMGIYAAKSNLRVRHLRSEVEKLTEVNQSKDQLFSIVSHDLRSAVHTLQINISRLKTLLSQLMTKAAIEVAEQTERLIGSVQSLLNNLLNWALNQTGQLSHDPEAIAMQPLINGICYDFLPLVSFKNIRLHHTLTEDLYCFCDVNSVKLIFRNLVDNAIKYTPADGSVIVFAEKQAGFCDVTVRDTGIGMDQEIINALFTGNSRRIQQDASGRRSTGIGLWLVKVMVEKNGGTLGIVSNPGKGTAVTVRLPLAPPQTS